MIEDSPHLGPFGPYELHECVAVGGMAEVFRALQKGEHGFRRTVALKRILPRHAENTEFIRMLIDEAKITVHLTHPNIVQVYDLGCIEEQYYIAMEFVHGYNMRVVQQQYGDGKPLPLPLVLHVVMHSLLALDYAHRATAPRLGHLHIIHRDMSPHNILLGFSGEVKVVDFGLAKAQGRLVQTGSGVVKGKVPYLSSEQARGEEIDHRSDLFSLGSCMYEWLTGKRLFFREDERKTVTAVRACEVAPPSTLLPELPSALNDIILNTLTKYPDERYPNAKTMYDDVFRLVQEEDLLMTQAEVAVFMEELFKESKGERVSLTPETIHALSETEITVMDWDDEFDDEPTVVDTIPGDMFTED